MRMRISLLALMLVALCTLCRAAGPGEVTALQEIVNEKVAMVAEWESEARLQILLTVAGIVCGGLITVLQPWGSNNWCKIASGLLGVSAAVVTGVISKAPVNYSAYEKAVLQGRDKISALRECLTYLKSTADPENQKTFREEFARNVNDFHQIALQLLGNEHATGGTPGKQGFLWHLLPVVYAQSPSSKTPARLTTLPASSTDLYFRGDAQSKSISEAKAKSFQDAVEQCAKYLLARGNSVPIADALQYARTSTAVADTAFTSGENGETYRYYTLLRLEKSLARPEVVAALAGTPRAGNTSKSKETSPLCASMKVEDKVMAEFKVGGKLVYIYLAGQHQQLPKFGQFGKPPDRADLVVITKPDTWTTLWELFTLDRKEGTRPPTKLKISSKEFDDLRTKVDEAHATVENKLENGKSFTVTVDGQIFRIGVETHYVLNYANLTVCPA
jgi:hypothetical protein